MKKLIDNFYIFSKLTFSFILLICLLFILYLFYTNYKKEQNIYEKEISITDVLQNGITKNNNLINDISTDIKNNQIALSQIEDNIKKISNKNANEDFSIIQKNINNINNSLILLKKEIENIKIDNTVSSKFAEQPDIIKNNIRDIIDLILIKYENNLPLQTEIDYLKKISKNEVMNFEKIFLLINKPYKGHNNLEKTFEKELDLYLKTIINKDPNSFFGKLILPYLAVSPTSENNVNDDLILKIKNIQISIQKRDLKNAYENILKINNHENFFISTTTEISKYINFKAELLKHK